MEREQLKATVTAAQKGDSEALNLLFNTYYNDVYYFALKTLKDADLACDITQETFVEIINTIGDLKAPEAFVTWMRQVTYHQCTRYFKKKKDVLVEEDEDGNTLFDTMEEDRQDFIPGEGVDQEDFRATILALLDTLSEEQRSAVLMYYYHEMNIKEIAETQKVSEGTVKSRLNYARKSLKKSVEDYEKKYDVKLHCVGILPLLLWLFANSGKEVMPMAAAKTVAGNIASATGASVAISAGGGVAAATATTVAGTGLMAKIAALPLVVKIISGITAGALLIGGVAMVGNELGKSPEPTEPVMQTQPSGGNNQGENNETTVPSVPAEMQPDSTEPTAYIVPEGCTYYCADGTVIAAGDEVCVQAAEGDRLVTQEFEYTYSTDIDGWKAARHVNNTTYEPFLAEINGEPLTSLAGVFLNHTGLGISPEIPASVKYMQYAFAGCNNLQAAPAIPDGVVNMEAAFSGCWCIQEVAEIPASVMNMTQTFANCYLLTGVIVINATPTAFEGCFAPYMGWFGEPIVLTGTGGNLEEIAATSSLGNVTVDPERLNNPQNPDLPGGSETPEEQPSEPEPQPPVVKNEYFNDSNYEVVKEQMVVKPRHVYWDNDNLVAECFVINGDAYKVHSVQVTNLLLETADGQIIAEANFDYTHEAEVPYGSYYTYTFTFSGEQIKLPNADLKNVVVKYGFDWQQIHNEYYNQDLVMYKLGNGYLSEEDGAYLQKKAEVRVRWAYWGEGTLNVRLNVANGTDTAITNVNVTKLILTNAEGIILSDAVGILQAEDYTNVVVEPGEYVDVDLAFDTSGEKKELIHAQWSIDASCAKVEQVDSFDGFSDEQILACMEICRAGRTPKNDNPGYTYMSETYVIGTLIDAELDIADVEVLYATVNGAPCNVYQTWDSGKIGEVLDYEEWDAATFGCRELHNIFLVESDEAIEITDDRTDYVIVEHHIMFRVYLTNGEYRDVLYGSDEYVLDIFGGGLMNPPQWYE